MSTIEPSHRREPVVADIGAEIDKLSLVQALHDFEVANVRVVDLTQRLVGISRELAAAREELAVLQREHEDLRTAHDEMQRSRALRLASKIRTVLNAL